jgi:hypothetical protein
MPKPAKAPLSIGPKIYDADCYGSMNRFGHDLQAAA